MLNALAKFLWIQSLEHQFHEAVGVFRLVPNDVAAVVNRLADSLVCTPYRFVLQRLCRPEFRILETRPIRRIFLQPVVMRLPAQFRPSRRLYNAAACGVAFKETPLM